MGKNGSGIYRSGQPDRQGEDQTLLVIANYQKEPQTITLEADVKNVLLNNCGEFQQKEKKLQLEGYQAVVLEMH